MYKNIIFDIGNVLLKFNPMKYLEEKGLEERAEHIYKEIFLSKEWLSLDRGTVTEKEAIEIYISRNKDYEDDIRLVFDGWYNILTPIEETVEILKSLKTNGYKLYYLSNFHHLAFEHILEKYDFFKLFDGGVVSYEEKLLKPEKEIYEVLIERYNLNPKESIFVDDTKVNIEMAENLNIKGIVFKDSSKFKECLIQLKINL